MSIKWKKIEPNNELDKKLYEKMTTILRPGYAEFGEEKTVLAVHYANIAEKCENFEVRDSDIFVCSYPKTGTTWCQEMVWMIVNNLNFEDGKRHLMQRFPFLEVSGMFTFEEAIKIDPEFTIRPAMMDSIKCVDELDENPRLIKSHLPWHLLPQQIKTKEKTPKIIYTIRNPKDTCVSYYHHCVHIDGYNGDFETFAELFLAGRINYGDYWKHVLGYWEQRNHSHLLLIKYEDMKRDLPSVIKKVATFLDKPLTEEQISILCEHLSFESMKINPAVNYNIIPHKKFFNNNAEGFNFIRSGTVGGYKSDMSEEIEKRFDDWIENNVLKTGIKIQ